MNPITTIQQLGGMGRLSAMIGAHSFVTGPDSLTFKWKVQSRANCVRIILDRDLYNLSFLKIRGTTVREVSTVEMVDSIALKSVFERETGLFLSL
ncbi:MAG: hypothetical protein UY48_C0006G0030 [Candidatus Gottesmanbacteria bacterium GW2011_GWB1_49_7]|uniref:Uncharacterized protein n=1 Tax=Candidatus Gottesmanbacteria bacterium GW2011_GWB1_49_7 TaxID=1618448 RepID=A0A0G1YDC0_9BACT|nr:MAG: hypothetical protein UY48_C0006G0030 [Candidatus Gottesmanbacteria bacterium GW2011_GWB1_49_7]